MGKVGGEVETDLGRLEWGVSGVVAAFPRKTSTERLEPGVQCDSDDQELAEGVEYGAEVALAEAVGEGEAKGEENDNFGPNQWAISWGKEKIEGG